MQRFLTFVKISHIENVWVLLVMLVFLETLPFYKLFKNSCPKVLVHLAAQRYKQSVQLPSCRHFTTFLKTNQRSPLSWSEFIRDFYLLLSYLYTTDHQNATPPPTHYFTSATLSPSLHLHVYFFCLKFHGQTLINHKLDMNENKESGYLQGQFYTSVSILPKLIVLFSSCWRSQGLLHILLRLPALNISTFDISCIYHYLN